MDPLPKIIGGFKVGKTYIHASQTSMMTIVGSAFTSTYGPCLIGEDQDGRLSPVSCEEDATVNWEEICVGQAPST